MRSVGGMRTRAPIISVLVVASLASVTACASTATGAARRLTSYRWHGVSQHEAFNTEITTIDGIADPARHRYSMHIHSSVGTVAGGNLVVSEGTWFQEDRNGRWCIWRQPANEIREGNQDLTYAGLDPTHWLSTLRDGDTSPTILISRFFGFPTNLTAKVHRQGDSLSVEFVAQPGLANLVLDFTDFGRAPAVTVPNATKECPYTPSGD
jgi:hypothetical protein